MKDQKVHFKTQISSSAFCGCQALLAFDEAANQALFDVIVFLVINIVLGLEKR